MMNRAVLKTLPGVLVVVAAAGLGLTVGSALQRTCGGGRPAAKAAIPAHGAASAVEAGVELHEGGGRVDDSVRATRLEDLSMCAGVTRWLHWLDDLEKAAPADFPRLARLATGNPAAMRLLAERWVQTAPRQMFDAIVAASRGKAGAASRELTDVLLEEWPKRDPNAVIAALNEVSEFEMQPRWRFLVAVRIMEKDPELGLRLFSEWPIENVGVSVKAVTAWAAANPRHAAQFTLEHPACRVSTSVMETIGKAWAATDPAQALEFAAGQPGPLGTVLANRVVKEWAGRNLSQAGDWLAKADPQVQGRLIGSFVEAWAKDDASGALAWCQNNLSGSALIRAVSGVVTGAAEKDLATAGQLVAAMDPSSARVEAAAVVAQRWFENPSSNTAVKPAEALAWLSSLDTESVRRFLDRFQWRWAASEPESMAAFLVSASDEQVPPSADSTLARQMVRNNPLRALEWTASLPADRALSAGSAAFNEWRELQPEAAMTWLNALPSDDPRRRTFLQNAIGVSRKNL